MEGFPYRSLRDWLSFLDAQVDLVHNNKEIDIRGEVAAISRKIAYTDGPAVIHENIKGYPNWRLHSDGLTAYRRIARGLGLDSSSPGEIRRVLLEKLKGKPLKPKEVATGP